MKRKTAEEWVLKFAKLLHEMPEGPDGEAGFCGYDGGAWDQIQQSGYECACFTSARYLVRRLQKGLRMADIGAVVSKAIGFNRKSERCFSRPGWWQTLCGLDAANQGFGWSSVPQDVGCKTCRQLIAKKQHHLRVRPANQLFVKGFGDQ